MGGVVLGVMGLLTWATYQHGSVRQTLLAVDGVRLVIEPAVVDLGTAREGDHREATFTVRNLSEQAVVIAGASANCGCIATVDLPLAIPPRESRSLRVSLHVEGKPADRIDRAVTYYSDAFPQGMATVQVRVIVAD